MLYCGFKWELIEYSGAALIFEEKEWLTAREALEIATLGGARVLGWDDVGSLEPASYIAFPKKRGFALAVEDSKKKILGATFADFTEFSFDEVFR